MKLTQAALYIVPAVLIQITSVAGATPAILRQEGSPTLSAPGPDSVVEPKDGLTSEDLDLLQDKGGALSRKLHKLLKRRKCKDEPEAVSELKGLLRGVAVARMLSPLSDGEIFSRLTALPTNASARSIMGALGVPARVAYATAEARSSALEHKPSVQAASEKLEEFDVDPPTGHQVEKYFDKKIDPCLKFFKHKSFNLEKLLKNKEFFEQEHGEYLQVFPKSGSTWQTMPKGEIELFQSEATK